MTIASLIRITCKGKKTDGVYMQSQETKNGQYIWLKSNPPMALYVRKSGRWAVTRPDDVKDERNFMSWFRLRPTEKDPTLTQDH